MITAPLDRQVVIDVDTEPKTVRLSALRGEPFLVLLGEPGMGKSTTLQQEAEADSHSILTCGEVMNGTPLPDFRTLYLDALDEYRSGENSTAKLLQLANAIADKNVTRWRLTCRAEDWRGASDLKAMRRAAGNGKIVVAHLQPLDEVDAHQVLRALGANDPTDFCAQARSRGGAAFLESPLSLRLLHTVVVSGGVWPTSRFDLFQKAIMALAHEDNPERTTKTRPSVETIVAVASKLCFLTMASGARAIWRSNSIPPADHIGLASLNLTPFDTDAALDTPLFRGEGHSFLAFHRTVSEFLAARFLAKITVGSESGPAFPLRRATALITGPDRGAPTELRGLYAWFAAHLNQLNDRKGALRLIERDAATTLAYGDAAAFDTVGRQAILLNLDRDDPYFLSSQDDTTVLGGLAQEDMAPVFLEILDREPRTHLQLTVLQALADGPPVFGVQAKLKEIVFSAHRPLWLRERAAAVHIRSATDPVATRRHLVEGLASQPIAVGQVMLRAGIMGDMEAAELTSTDVRRLLMDFAGLSSGDDDEDIADRGALTGLAWSMKDTGPDDLFDEPISSGQDVRLRGRSQIRSFIDQALAFTILRNPDVTAARLWAWVGNARDYVWDMLDSSVVEAIQGWIDHEPRQREIELFLEIASTDTADDRPWVSVNYFTSTVRRAPTSSLIDGLLATASKEPTRKGRQRLLHLAAYVARLAVHWHTWRDTIVARLGSERGNVVFLRDLLADPNAKYKKEESKRLAAVNARTEAARAHNVASMTPQLGMISSGAAEVFGTLGWAANHYLHSVVFEKAAPLSKITEYTSPEIAAAIAEGLVRFTIRADLRIEVEDLGRAEAKNGSYSQERVVAAGLHQALLHGRESELTSVPMILALIGLRQDYSGDDSKGTFSISRWATRHLASDPAAGSNILVRYWQSAIDAGDEDLDGIDKFVANYEPELIKAFFVDLLAAQPDLPEKALRQLLITGIPILSDADLADLTHANLARAGSQQVQQDIWSFVALALDPEGFRAKIADDRMEMVLLRPNGQLSQAMLERSRRPDALDLIRVRFLGKHPQRENDWRGSDRPSAIVKAAIKRLSASKVPDVGARLKAMSQDVDASWRDAIAHAAAEHARMIRDDIYVAPTIEALLSAIAGGPPASPADLAAVVLEELDRYRASARTSSDNPWKNFWNTDEHGAAVSPRIENEDRDRLLEVLRPRFERYHIVDSMPEAQRGENTRADVLLLSHAGKNLPIEAKRHTNRELWTAPLEQLMGYAADSNAHGFGIYLVFWFGKEFPVPARTDRRAKPETAGELETMLIDDLPVHLRDKISIVVLDVSRPPEMIAAIARRRKAAAKKSAAE